MIINKYEIEQMIKDRLLELDGAIDGKPNEDGTHDLYFVEIEDNNEGIIVDFITKHGADKKNQKHSKYKISVDYL